MEKVLRLARVFEIHKGKIENFFKTFFRQFLTIKTFNFILRSNNLSKFAAPKALAFRFPLKLIDFQGLQRNRKE